MKLKKISTMALAAILSATSVAPAIIPATTVMAYDNSQYLNVREAELFKGDNLQLKVNGVYNDTRIVWKSDNSSVAEVSSNGLVRAKKAGFAILQQKSYKPHLDMEIVQEMYCIAKYMSMKSRK